MSFEVAALSSHKTKLEAVCWETKGPQGPLELMATFNNNDSYWAIKYE